MNERPHVDYFDGLRIFAALCVIFMHTAAGPLRAGVNTDWHLLNVCTSLAFTAVPLFFMMSGYLLMTSRKTADISVLLHHRLPRLVVPLAGWTVVAVLWQALPGHTLTPGAIWARLVAALHGPAMVHFWYLYTLIALYALSPILYGGIQALGKSGRVYLFVLIAAVSAHTILMTVLPDGAAQYVDLDIFDKLKIFGGHMATFVLGYLLGSYEKEIPNWLLALGIVGMCLCGGKLAAQSAAWIPVLALGLFVHAGLLSLVLLSAIFPKPMSAFGTACIRWLYRRRPFVRRGADPAAAAEKWCSFVAEYHDAFAAGIRHRGKLAGALALALLQCTAYMSVAYCTYRGFGLRGVPFWQVTGTQVLLYIGASCFPMPGASGASEGTFYLAFSPLFGDYLTTAMLIWRLASYYLTIVLGYIAVVAERVTLRRAET